MVHKRRGRKWEGGGGREERMEKREALPHGERM
jgi:hypothetical protein